MKRTPLKFTPLAIAVLAFGCDTPSEGPASPDGLDPAMNTSPAVHVLNTQLRGITNPEIEPTGAWGHVQIKLTADNGGYLVEWRGRIFNPDGETFAQADIFYGGPDATPVPGAGPLFSLFRNASQSCDILSFSSQGITDEEHLPADIGDAMIVDPDHYLVRVMSTDDALLGGGFRIADPREVFGFNPQPDPPGASTRCEIVGDAIIIDPPEGF